MCCRDEVADIDGWRCRSAGYVPWRGCRGDRRAELAWYGRNTGGEGGEVRWWAQISKAGGPGVRGVDGQMKERVQGTRRIWSDRTQDEDAGQDGSSGLPDVQAESIRRDGGEMAGWTTGVVRVQEGHCNGEGSLLKKNDISVGMGKR